MASVQGSNPVTRLEMGWRLGFKSQPLRLARTLRQALTTTVIQLIQLERTLSGTDLNDSETLHTQNAEGHNELVDNVCHWQQHYDQS